MNDSAQAIYNQLIEDYKKIKKIRKNFSEEYSEKKGNMAAYEAERDKQIEKAKSLGINPGDLKDEIEKLSNSIEKEISNINKICEELEQEPLG